MSSAPGERSAQVYSQSAASPTEEEETTPSPPLFLPLPKRQRSVQFAIDTHTSSPSAMSSHYRARHSRSESDEATPIRRADDNEDRNYNTSNSDGRSNIFDAPRPKPSPAPVEDSDETSTPWYRGLAEKYGSVSLENKGSVARDHLALERTFLAWLRTSLAFASIGIAVTQLFRLNTAIASKSQETRMEYRARRQNGGGDLPFSPFVGHSLDVDLMHQVFGYGHSKDIGNTLLDQMFSAAPMPLASSGEAATKLRHAGKPLGATFLAISIVVLFVGCHRYFESQHWIIRGKFPASRGSVSLVVLIAALLIVGSLVVVIVIAPSNYHT